MLQKSTVESKFMTVSTNRFHPALQPFLAVLSCGSNNHERSRVLRDLKDREIFVETGIHWDDYVQRVILDESTNNTQKEDQLMNRFRDFKSKITRCGFSPGQTVVVSCLTSGNEGVGFFDRNKAILFLVPNYGQGFYPVSNFQTIQSFPDQNAYMSLLSYLQSLPL